MITLTPPVDGELGRPGLRKYHALVWTNAYGGVCSTVLDRIDPGWPGSVVGEADVYRDARALADHHVQLRQRAA